MVTPERSRRLLDTIFFRFYGQTGRWLGAEAARARDGAAGPPARAARRGPAARAVERKFL